MTDRFADIIDSGYLDGITELSMDDLRARRAECKDVETGMSYLRRMVQGRLDVVAAERARREEGGSEDDLGDLIARLPQLLAGSTRTPGTGRLPGTLGTGTVPAALSDRLDELVRTSGLTDPSELSDAALSEAGSTLESFEREVSGLRRQLFDRIDALEAEVARRYRTGEASVDSLLSDS